MPGQPALLRSDEARAADPVNPWLRAVESDRSKRDEPWGDPAEWSNIFPVGRYLTRQSFADGFARIAREKSEWAGLPVPLMGEKLTIEPSYFAADKEDELNRIMNPEQSLRTCKLDDDSESTALRNHFWSDRLRCHVGIWQMGNKFICVKVRDSAFAPTRLDYDLRTVSCAEAWALETEQTALETLRTLLSHQQFRQYLLAGAFIETSTRSKVVYLFRRLRPTVAISGSTGRLKVLCALCQHPIAYYRNSWAGAMTPSDDILAHLMLMRGDESMFWKRSNQHHPSRPEAGL